MHRARQNKEDSSESVQEKNEGNGELMKKKGMQLESKKDKTCLSGNVQLTLTLLYVVLKRLGTCCYTILPRGEIGGYAFARFAYNYCIMQQVTLSRVHQKRRRKIFPLGGGVWSGRGKLPDMTNK